MDTVLKIIPLQDPTKIADENNLPLPVPIAAAIHECQVLKTVNSLKDYRTQASPLCWTGFNQITDIMVVQGSYPQDLIKSWLQWRKSHEGFNSCPNTYMGDSKFLVILMEYGGQSLESEPVKNLRQVGSIIRQLVHALSLAESRIEFEHRDLYQ